MRHAAGLIGVLASGCGIGAGLPAGPGSVAPLPLSAGAPERASLVLVVNDTMRADWVGAYGGAAHTPAFDRLAEQGVLFERVAAPAPWTLPSMASLFTSLYPSQHGVITQPFKPDATGEPPPLALTLTDALSPDAVTIAEALSDGGYRTAAFVSNPWMERRFGFGQGFSTYQDAFARWGVPGTEVSAAALAWLEQVPPGERFFLYVHYLDSHRPYAALSREETAARAREIASDVRYVPARGGHDIAGIVRLDDGTRAVDAGHPPTLRLLELAYQGGVENFDRALAALLEGLERRQDYERTAVIVTSDHGEALYARGWGNHGGGLYDDEIAVPMAARLPGVAAGTRFADPVSLVDLMPTVCAYLGVPCPGDMAGVSLVGDDGGRRRRYVVSEGVMYEPRHRSIRNRALKLIWQPGYEEQGRNERSYALFDLASDPTERYDLLAPSRRAAVAEGALAALKAALPGAVPEGPALSGRSAPLDAELTERLRALGYVQ